MCHLMATLATSVDRMSKLATSGNCALILNQLVVTTCGHGIVLRLIIESIFRPEWAHIFGANVENNDEDDKRNFESESHKLLEENYSFDSWAKTPLSHTTIFHAGSINRDNSTNKRRNNRADVVNTNNSLPDSVITINQQIILDVLSGVSRAQPKTSVSIALLLVELISPDIMFIGFPWPDENLKFTIERDLAIKKTFENHPMAWELLEMVAVERPDLCVCSVLVRALTAAYLSVWSTSAVTAANELPTQVGFVGCSKSSISLFKHIF